MAGGYTGRILVSDLTAGKIWDEQLDEQLYYQFIGGQGLGVKLLYQRQPARVDALGDQNILAFMPGLLSGTGAPSSSRLTVLSKSPLTGGWGEANVGGYMARELKRAGYDGILFQGVSPSAVYLLIYKGKVELRQASNLWGKDAIETVEWLRREIGDKRLSVGCIGPSGESLSLISSIIFDKGRAAGRSGLGAVMGSKRLKAVAVKGDRKVPVADVAQFGELRRRIVAQIKKSPAAKMWSTQGLAGATEGLIKQGATPIKNWTLSGIEAIPFHAKIGGKSVNRYLVANSQAKASCADCPIACGATLKLEDENGLREFHRPEYETIAGFGAMCFNDDIESIIKANDICNRYGIDTISTSSSIAFAIGCYQQGIITKEDTDGIALGWNNAPAVMAMLMKIVKREGIGDLLADGVKRAAERIGNGAEEYAIHAGGQEIAYHDPRLIPARGTAYMCDPTPGRHTSALAACAIESGGSLESFPEFQLPKVGLRDYGNKSVIYGIASKYEHIFASCGICKLLLYVGEIPLVGLVAAATGWDFGPKELLTTGERISTLRQMFNIREGIEPSEICLPLRLRKSMSTGPLKDLQVNFDLLRKQYYEGMGWNSKNGYPLQKSLDELDLTDLAKY